MRPLWQPTLVWIAAVIAAVLLALATPDGTYAPVDGTSYPTTPLAPR
jgi:hypothetical protein